MTERDYAKRPLTEEEQVFAEENHELIYKYMKAYKLDLEEWYDVLIIPYLQAVKKYFSYLDLREYKFEKICFRILDSARKNHWIKAERRKCYPSGKYFYYPTQTTTEDEALALGMLKVAVESLTDTQREILLSLVNGSRSSDTKPVREIYGLLQKQTDQQQRYYFRMNTKGERKKMYVLKNGKNFYIRIENGSVIKTPKFVEATKFRNTEIAQTVIDLKPGQLHSYRVCDVYNKIVYPKGRTRVIYTPRERKMIYHKAEGRCQLCGCKITYDEMSLDHIVPLAMGGEDSFENLQATCEPCNSHKKALLPEAYFDKVNRTFVFQMNKKYSHNLLWKLSKLFIGRLEKQA